MDFIEEISLCSATDQTVLILSMGAFSGLTLFDGDGLFSGPDETVLLIAEAVSKPQVKFAEPAYGALTISGHAPSTSLIRRLPAPSGSLLLQGHAPAVQVRTPVLIPVPDGSLQLQGHAPSLSIHIAEVGTSQIALEYLVSASPEAAVSQVVIEYLAVAQADGKTSQAALEYLVSELGKISVSQTAVEYLVHEVGLIGTGQVVAEFLIANRRAKPDFMLPLIRQIHGVTQ